MSLSVNKVLALGMAETDCLSKEYVYVTECEVSNKRSKYEKGISDSSSMLASGI
jgi:hypothetical protein